MDDELRSFLDLMKRLMKTTIAGIESDAAYRDVVSHLITHNLSVVCYPDDIPSKEDIATYKLFLERALEDIVAFEDKLLTVSRVEESRE